MATNSKSCFVIAPIGKENSPDRKRSDQVFKHIIAPAAAACGAHSGEVVQRFR
jgi:hypothetical protein